MRKWVKKALLAIVTFFINFLFGVLYSNGTISLSIFVCVFAFTIIVGILYLVVSWIIIDKPFKKVNYSELEKIVSKLKLFEIDLNDRDALSNLLHKKQKIKCIYQLRFKRNINWIDSIYWGFLRELSSIGIETEILIHDTEFHLSSSHITVKERRKYERDLKLLIAWMKTIASPKIKIILASKFYRKRKNIKNFIEKIYNVFLPFLANYPHQLIIASKPDITIHSIRYVLGLCMMCNQEYKGIILAMIWNGRKLFLDNYILDHMKGRDIYKIIGNTFLDADGVTPLSTNDRNNFSLNANEETIYQSLKSLNKMNLKYIWHYVLGRMDSEFSNTDEMRHKIKEGIINMKTKVEGSKQ